MPDVVACFRIPYALFVTDYGLTANRQAGRLWAVCAPQQLLSGNTGSPVLSAVRLRLRGVKGFEQNPVQEVLV